MFVYREWTHRNPPVIELPENSEIIGGGYELTGKTNCNKVNVEINNEKEDVLPVSEGKFDVSLNLDEWEEGWHYIKVSVQRPFTRWTVEKDCFIHIIPGQANVYVPGEIIRNARKGNERFNREYETALIKSYTYKNNYFDFKGVRKNSESARIDEQGIVQNKYESGWEYNPVSIAQQALGYYNDYYKDNELWARKKFLEITEWFLQNQAEDGAYPYPFPFKFKPSTELPEGFVSAMAQGQILSVMARAYGITQDIRYLECGKKTLDFMITSGDDDIFKGCSRRLEDFCDLSSELSAYSDYEVYEEYVFDPSTYVLNGDLFALLGLADWKEAATNEYGAEEAEEAFEKGIKGIEILLPYYDYYGWSSYDLFQYTDGSSITYFTSSYAHRCHIFLLHTLAEVSGSKTFKEYSELFKEYSDDSFWSQTEILYKEK